MHQNPRPVSLEIAGWLVGDARLALQNLTDDHHLEFSNPIGDTTPTEPERSVYGKLTWRF